MREVMISAGRHSPGMFVTITTALSCLMGCQTGVSGDVPQSAMALEAAGVYYYVDAENGNDSYSGRLAKPSSGYLDGPFRTIQAGYDRLPRGATLWVKKGVYRETLTLRTKASASSPIVIRVFPGDEGQAVINAADEIDGWQRCTSQTECAGNPNWRHIFYADVGFEVKQLFQNGSRLKPSRYPRQGWRYPTSTYTGAPDTVLLDSTLRKSNGYFVGSTCHVKTNLWHIDQIPVLAYSMTGGKVTLQWPTRYDISPTFGYYFTHTVGDINEEGQWARDATRARIYLWPIAESLENIEATSREFGVDSEVGCSYHTIQGLTVKYAIDGIRLYRTDHIIVTGNTVEYALCCGIVDFESSYSSITNNTVRYVSDSGIRDLEASSNDLIEGNTVYATGAESFGDDLAEGVGLGILIYGSHARILRNRVDRSGYTGIMVGGNTSGKEIAYNYVTNSCLSLSDGGGIYTAGHSDSNEYDYFHHNIVTDVWGYLGGYAELAALCAQSPASCRGGAVGIYLDEEGNHRAFEHNTVIAGGDSGIFFHWTRDNTVTGNTLFGNAKHQIIFSGHADPRNVLQSNDMQSNLLIATDTAQMTFQLNVDYHNIDFGESDGNYFYHPNNTKHVIVCRDLGGDLCTRYSLEEWQRLSGKDPNSVDLSLAGPAGADTGIPVIFINPSMEPLVMDLGTSTFLDVYGQLIKTSVTLAQFESVVLFPLTGTAGGSGGS